MFDHFLNRSIIPIWKMANCSNSKFSDFSKLDIFGMNFQNLTLKNLQKNIKYYNLENLKIINFTISKINILQ